MNQTIIYHPDGLLIKMKGKNKIKYILKDLIRNNDKISSIYWDNIFWMTSDFSIGFDREGFFYVEKKNRKNWFEDDLFNNYIKYHWVDFINSDAFNSLNYVNIIKRVNELRLLYKPNLNSKDIINCTNQAIKRELIAKYGYKNLLENLPSIILDIDGTSELLRIESVIEPIVLVKVIDPSTNNQYLLRVPPEIESCIEAIAWTFNLNTKDYTPILET